MSEFGLSRYPQYDLENASLVTSIGAIPGAKSGRDGCLGFDTVTFAVTLFRVIADILVIAAPMLIIEGCTDDSFFNTVETQNRLVVSLYVQVVDGRIANTIGK